MKTMECPLDIAREAMARFQARGFRIVYEHYDAQNFGNLVIELTSPTLEIRLIRDRGQYWIDARKTGTDEWYLLDDILAVAKSDQKAPVEAMPKVVAECLGGHLTVIEQLHHAAQLATTLAALKQRRRQYLDDLRLRAGG